MSLSRRHALVALGPVSLALFASYRVAVVARDAAQNVSSARTAGFRVVR